MKAKTQEADAFGDRLKRGEERLACRGEGRQVRDRLREALRAGDQGEVAELDLEGHGASGNVGALDPRPCITSDPLELGREPLGIPQILVESPFGADRFV